MEVIGSSSPKPSVGFLDTPLEIRLQIYRYCLVAKNPIITQYVSVDPWKFSSSRIRDRKKSLLLVSKRVGLEALDVLYGENVFQILLHGEGEYYLKQHFAKANIDRMRRMQFVMQPQGVSYGRMLESTLWSPIFANLTKLSIVAQQPLQPQDNYNAPPFEHEMQKWTQWLRAVLQYTVRQLSSSCTVEVDDDDMEETSLVMRESLPGGFRKVQTLAGDLCFRRNQYSEESGYWNEDYDAHDWFDADSNAS